MILEVFGEIPWSSGTHDIITHYILLFWRNDNDYDRIWSFANLRTQSVNWRISSKFERKIVYKSTVYMFTRVYEDVHGFDW